ncbi:TPA: hypothetical protein HA251_02010 [Candidatus Woesearchaeota archaeon]|nr:hypothetical protein [Candidatus Woesearchaeota archaeon]
MTEPLNVTLDRLSEEYDAIRRRCESVERPCDTDLMSLRATIASFNKIGILVEVPEYFRQKTSTIEQTPRIYRVHNVPYRGENRTVDVTRELLDNGTSRTQDEWLERYPLGTIGQIGIPDTEIYFALIQTLDKDKEHSDIQQRRTIEEVTEVIREDFRKYWMMTSTKAYPEKTVHQYRTPYAITKKSINGKSGNLIALPDGDAIAKILGNTTAARLNETACSITGSEIYVYRNAKNERALVLGVGYDDDGFGIGAGNGISSDRPARGMAVLKNE